MKIAIVGAGTIIFTDEGVGVYAAKYLSENYDFEGDVTIVDGGVLGFGLMNYYQDYDYVFILDTITIEDHPGSIYVIPSDELLGLGSYKQTAHEVEIVEMLEICSLLEKIADITIIGIVPEDIQTVGVNLTQTLKMEFSKFVGETLKQLDKLKIGYTKNSKDIGLEEIIATYANPQTMREIKNDQTNNHIQ